MKIGILCHADASGGAARAAYRLMKALQSTPDVNVEMRVGFKTTNENNVRGPNGGFARFLQRAGPSIDSLPLKFGKSYSGGLRSTGIFGTLTAREVNGFDVDVVNLHWMCAGFMSIEEIGKIRKPIVWTMHDMWPFSGSLHYTDDGPNAIWRSGSNERAGENSQWFDFIDGWVWARKRRAWDVASMTFVSPSNWLSHCASESSLLKRGCHTVIPNALDTDIYRPLDKAFARSALRLPLGRPVVTFGALGGSVDPRKGWDLLEAALRIVRERKPDTVCVVYGQSKPTVEPDVGLPIYWLGHVSDDVTLALIYSASDVFALPSRQENLPQAGTEAQACGCPVVAFNTTGMPDVVHDQRTGALVDPFNVTEYAEKIVQILSVADEAETYRLSSRSRAVEKWSNGVVARAYVNVFRKAIEGCSTIDGDVSGVR